VGQPKQIKQSLQAVQPVVLNPVGYGLSQKILSTYFSNDEMLNFMNDYIKRCGHMSKLFSIGKSSAGRRDLWVLELSNNPGIKEAKPYIKFVANMHGDEPSGRQLLLKFADWMCSSYPSDPTVANLVDNFHFMLLPSMNPDGFDARRRTNRQGKDLNRDFPDPLHLGNWKTWSDQLKPVGTEAAETLALMNFSLQYRFIAGVSMHEGAVVANYPWDGSIDKKTAYSSCPDDATYRYLAAVYANKNSLMRTSREFKGGITNGAAWYPLYGGMQDWNYLMADCMDLTLELSERKWPFPGHWLPKIWEDNRDALVDFSVKAAYGGAWGSIMGSRGNQPIGNAAVRVDGISKLMSGGPLGDFYRPLAPGRYIITAMALGFTVRAPVIIRTQHMAHT